MQRDVVLATSRAVLTTWLPSDADDLYPIHSDPQTMRFVRHGRPETRQETAELVASYIEEQAGRGWTKWRVADPDGATIGRAGFGGTESDRQLAFLIRRSQWGRGLATEVAGALVDWHLAYAPASSLSALAAVPNTASIRVLRKLGLDDVGSIDYEGISCRSFRLRVSGRSPSVDDEDD